MKAKAQNVGPKKERKSASMGGYCPEVRKSSAKAKKGHFFQLWLKSSQCLQKLKTYKHLKFFLKLQRPII